MTVVEAPSPKHPLHRTPEKEIHFLNLQSVRCNAKIIFKTIIEELNEITCYVTLSQKLLYLRLK